MTALKTYSVLAQTAQKRSDNTHGRFELVASNDTRRILQSGYTFTKHIVDYRKIFESYIKVLDMVTSHARA